VITPAIARPTGCSPSLLRAVPGRKTLVFFSEGLALPPAAIDRFRAVIDLANRVNVAVYSVDTAGLRVESTLEEARKEVLALGQERLRQNAAGETSVLGAMTRGLERNEDLLRANPHGPLAQLAEETGGFLVRDTNDLPGGLRRIDEDMRFHYLLTYVPSNQEYDGKWRRITIKVRQSDVEVRARNGYYAVHALGPAPVLPYEAAALAVLDHEDTVPNAFAVRMAALAFPEPDRPGLVPIVVQVRTDALSFQVDDDSRQYLTDFTIVVRIKDGSGRVVRKMSQHYELVGAADQVEVARRAGEVTFYRDPVLEPGVYTLEAVVYDAPSGRASVRVATIELPPSDSTRLQASSLVLVRRSEEVPEGERDPNNPLHHRHLLLYPSLGEAFSKAADKELSFFVTLYPRRASAVLRAQLRVVQNGRTVATAPVDLAAADARGRVQQTGRVSLDALSPGRYELVFTVADAGHRVARSAPLTVVP
jgi:hypothetical protein